MASEIHPKFSGRAIASWPAEPWWWKRKRFLGKKYRGRQLHSHGHSENQFKVSTKDKEAWC